MADFVYPLGIGLDQIETKTPDEQRARSMERPGFLATLDAAATLLDAAATLENSVYGEATRLDSPRLSDPYAKQEGFDWKAKYDAVSPDIRRDYGHKLIDIWNDRSWDARLAQIDKEIEARRTRDAAGLWGAVASMAAGTLDPLSWAIPVGGEYLAAGRTIGQGIFNAARLGATVGASQAVQEAALHQTSVTRSMEESMYAVGGGVLLGTLLGGGVHVLTNAERATAENTMRRLLKDQPGPIPIGEAVDGVASGNAASVSAAAAAKLTREDLSPAGRLAYYLQDYFQMSPNARTNMAPSVKTREIAQNLADNAVVQNMNVEGRSLGASAEIMARMSAEGRMASIVPVVDDLYKQHRVANGGGAFSRGKGMTRNEFLEQVSFAARRGDVAMNGDEYVTKAAQTIREKVIEPFKREAIDAGLLPADVDVSTASSYLHRWWNKQALEANEREVKAVFTEWLVGEVKRLDDVNYKEARRRIDKFEGDKTAWRAKQQRRMDAAYNEIGDIEINKLRRAEMQSRGVVSGEDMAAEGLTSGDVIRMARAIETGSFKRPEVETLVSWLRRSGGMYDQSGELARMGITSKSAPGFIKSKRRTIVDTTGGYSIDDAARAAWEDGFFPHLTERPTPREFLDALEGDFSGMMKVVREADLDKAHAAQLYDDVTAVLDRIGYRKGKRIATDAEIENIMPKVRQVYDEIDNARVSKLNAKIDAIKRDIDGGEYIINRNHRQAAVMNDYKYKADLDLDASNGYRAAAEDAANAVYDKLTGRVYDQQLSAMPEWMVPVSQGPLKDRTFSIPDHLVEKYLHNDILGITEKYARQMSSEIELTRKFGRADMRDQLTEIKVDYEGMRNAVMNAKSIDDIKAITDEHGLIKAIRDKIRNPNDPAQIEAVRQRALKYLNAQERADVRDITAMRDMIRGMYQSGDDNWMRIANAANSYNYMRLSGGFLLSNLPDVARPVMIHGLKPFMSDGIKPLLSNLDAVKVSVKEAQKFGVVVERWLQSRLMTMADLTDPLAAKTPFERVMQQGSRIASRWNGILMWNDFNQTISSVMAQDRMIRAMMNGTDTKYLAVLGIDTEMANRIGRQLATHHDNIDGVLIANVSKWDDPSGAMARAYGAALKKDTNTVAVLRSVGDVPLLASTPVGKMMLQFQTFGIAAHQRVLIRGLQEGPTNFISGMVAMTSIGMMAAYLRAVRGGQDRREKFMKAAQNPGYLIGEGLDLGGFLTVPFWAANVGEKAFKKNIIKDPIKAALGDANVGESQRYAARGVMSSLMGPTASLLDTVVEFAQRASRKAAGESTEKNDIALKKMAAQLPPFATMFPIREISNTMIGH